MSGQEGPSGDGGDAHPDAHPSPQRSPALVQVGAVKPGPALPAGGDGEADPEVAGGFLQNFLYETLDGGEGGWQAGVPPCPRLQPVPAQPPAEDRAPPLSPTLRHWQRHPEGSGSGAGPGPPGKPLALPQVPPAPGAQSRDPSHVPDAIGPFTSSSWSPGISSSAPRFMQSSWLPLQGLILLATQQHLLPCSIQPVEQSLHPSPSVDGQTPPC